MSLYLNDTQITGNSLKVTGTLTLASEDMSGQSSYTDTAETGDKPKQLAVRLGIPFKSADKLKTIITLAESRDETGGRSVFNIRNNTATAMGIRLVSFSGDVSVSEDEGVKLWNVSFKLSEKRSVPELKESRQQAQTVSDQAAAGTTVTDDAEASSQAVPEQVELSSFENILSFLNDAVGDADLGTA